MLDGELPDGELSEGELPEGELEEGELPDGDWVDDVSPEGGLLPVLVPPTATGPLDEEELSCPGATRLTLVVTS